MSDDPIADFNRYDAERARLIEQLPKCAWCDEPIQDEYFYLINDDPVCQDCLDTHFKKAVEDYVE